MPSSWVHCKRSSLGGPVANLFGTNLHFLKTELSIAHGELGVLFPPPSSWRMWSPHQLVLRKTRTWDMYDTSLWDKKKKQNKTTKKNRLTHRNTFQSMTDEFWFQVPTLYSGTKWLNSSWALTSNFAKWRDLSLPWMLLWGIAPSSLLWLLLWNLSPFPCLLPFHFHLFIILYFPSKHAS